MANKMNKENQLTLEKLKQVLDYDPASGIFTWKIQRSSSANVGDIAGSINHAGYRRIIIGGIRYRAHRLAFFYVNGRWPIYEIDHINNIKDDNRISNLREASRCENALNRPLNIQNTSGVKGVHFYRRYGKYSAQIRVNKKQIHLGFFADINAATSVIRAYREKVHGEFANHGVPA